MSATVTFDNLSISVNSAYLDYTLEVVAGDWHYVLRLCRREKLSLYEISINRLDPDDAIQIMLSMCDLL